MQLHSAPSESVPAFVAKRAEELNLSILSMLATATESSPTNDISGVKEMIRDPIVQLQGQSGHDISRSSQCEQNKAKQDTKRIKLTAEIHTLAVTSKATIQEATHRVNVAQQELTSIQSSLGQARNAAKIANEQLITDANSAASSLQIVFFWISFAVAASFHKVN